MVSTRYRLNIFMLVAVRLTAGGCVGKYYTQVGLARCIYTDPGEQCAVDFATDFEGIVSD